jgi:hypothetical protein
MAHTYNPRYSESREQEDCGSKPAHGPMANSSHVPIWKISITKKGCQVVQDEGPEFKPQYRKKKKKKKKNQSFQT